MRKVIFIQSHPIQYFVPLYQKASMAGISLEVWYCSDEGVSETLDVQFGVKFRWDLPILEGYQYEFLPNDSSAPSINNGFWGLKNTCIKKKLKAIDPCLVIVPGWNYASYIIAINAAKKYGHTVALRGESPLNQELIKPLWKLFLKKVFIANILFKKVDYFLYIGSQNKNFYKYNKVKHSRLVFSPYAVDNDRFRKAYEELKTQKEQLKTELGLSREMLTIVYSGKYISKKRPLDLINAFASLRGIVNCQLVMVGDGELKSEMSKLIEAIGVKDVFFTGFVNQTEIPKYYAIADVFVMCSQSGETWGLSVNEAMNFHLPLIVSRTAGCASDLVDEGKNGLVFNTGDVAALTRSLEKILTLPLKERVEWGEKSAKIVSQYSYEVTIENIKNLLG